GRFGRLILLRCESGALPGFGQRFHQLPTDVLQDAQLALFLAFDAFPGWRLESLFRVKRACTEHI
ncbi:MAG: hypothetical protein ACLFVU_13375, partial [Phycisphaerae bacterium]